MVRREIIISVVRREVQARQGLAPGLAPSTSWPTVLLHCAPRPCPAAACAARGPAPCTCASVACAVAATCTLASHANASARGVRRSALVLVPQCLPRLRLGLAVLVLQLQVALTLTVVIMSAGRGESGPTASRFS